jgi:hypothetical protein
VTHVFVPEKTGVAGVCCPVHVHDVGFWCNPPNPTNAATSECASKGTAGVDRPAGGDVGGGGGDCSTTGTDGGGAKRGASTSTLASTSSSAPTPTKTVTTPVPTSEEGSAFFDESAFSRFVLEFVGNDWLLPAPALARDGGGDNGRSGGLGDDAHSGGSCSCSGGTDNCVAAGAGVGSYVELLDSYLKPALSRPYPMGTETGIGTVGGVECPDDQYKDPEYERRKAAFTHRRTYRIRYQAQGDRALSKEHARERQLELRLALTSSTLPLLLT